MVVLTPAPKLRIEARPVAEGTVATFGELAVAAETDGDTGRVAKRARVVEEGGTEGDMQSIEAAFECPEEEKVTVQVQLKDEDWEDLTDARGDFKVSCSTLPPETWANNGLLKVNSNDQFKFKHFVLLYPTCLSHSPR